MMRKIVEQHLERLRQARHGPDDPDPLGEQLFERLYPRAAARLRRVQHPRIPAHAPDWYFESELRRSGLWEMMERCYPTPHAQSQ